MSSAWDYVDDDHVGLLRGSARTVYLALLDAYVTTGGDVEVFVEPSDPSPDVLLRVRPSNVHGEVHLSFQGGGDLSDVQWRPSSQQEARRQHLQQLELAELQARHQLALEALATIACAADYQPREHFPRVWRSVNPFAEPVRAVAKVLHERDELLGVEDPGAVAFLTAALRWFDTRVASKEESEAFEDMRAARERIPPEVQQRLKGDA